MGRDNCHQNSCSVDSHYGRVRGHVCIRRVEVPHEACHSGHCRGNHQRTPRCWMTGRTTPAENIGGRADCRGVGVGDSWSNLAARSVFATRRRRVLEHDETNAVGRADRVPLLCDVCWNSDEIEKPSRKDQYRRRQVQTSSLRWRNCARHQHRLGLRFRRRWTEVTVRAHCRGTRSALFLERQLLAPNRK